MLDYERVKELRAEGYDWLDIAKLMNVQEGDLRRGFMAWVKEQRRGNEHYRES